MSKILCLLVITIIYWGCVPSAVKQASQEIDKYSRMGKARMEALSFHEVRMKFFNEQKAAATSMKNFDTLFVLDQYSLEDATYHGKIWNRHLSYNYQYRYGKFTYDSLSVFTKYMCYLVQNWDTLGIRNEEKLYSNMIPAYWIYASRVIRKNKKMNVEVIRFKSFFKFQRDGY